jgi:acyl-CoA thioester hydrolase
MTTSSPPFRVRYADTDAQAVAYYASFFTWQEVGELHFLEAHGLHVPTLDSEGRVLTVAESYCRYLKPAAYDDLLTVRTRVAAAAPKRFVLENEIVRVEDGEVLATGRLADVFLAPSGEVLPVPDQLIEAAGERCERVTISPRVAGHLGPPPPGAVAHTHEIQVRYAETDAQGVAYCGSYYAWFEDGRNELTRAVGLPYSALERRGILLPVAEAFCRYFAPLRARERFRMITAVPKLGKARMTFTNRLTSLDGTREIAAGYTVHACTGPDGRPHALAPEIVERFSPAP